MNNQRKQEQIEAVSSWWNLSRNQKKWDVNYNDRNIHEGTYLRSRQEVVLKFASEIVSARSGRILELGYGGGQTLVELGRLGKNEIYGIDISEILRDSAEEKCKKENPEGKFYIKAGNIEQDIEFPAEMFDVVVVIGALQYLYSPEDCFKEVRRVLKPGGYFIIAQRNIYSLSNLTSFRGFLRSAIIFLLREEYELFPSFKSMFVDSKIGKVLGRFQNSHLFNTKMMLKGHDVWKFNIKKRVNSYRSLKKKLEKRGFSIVKSEGAYYPFSENPLLDDFNIKFDKVIKNVVAKKNAFTFLSKRLGRSVVFLARK
jgi:ubiquinone/menaquinone biosynthesis C-methylase UbiE